MAKKRFCNVEIWDKTWFMELSPKLKCLVRYIYDKCDYSGLWVPNWKLVSIHINDTISSADLELLPSDQFEMMPEGKIFMPQYINFQYGVLSEQCMAHKPVFSAINKNNLSNRVFNRVSDTLQYKEKEKEKDIEEEKVENKSDSEKIETKDIENQFQKLNDFIREEASQLLKLKTQLSVNEFDKIMIRVRKNDFTTELIKKTLQSMSNTIGIEKKYASVYLTLLNWLDRAKTSKEIIVSNDRILKVL